GYTFTGWYRDKEATDEWDFDKDAVSGNITLYAGWTGNAAKALSKAPATRGGNVLDNVTVGPEWSYITLIEGYSNASGVSITVTNNYDEAVTVENYSFDVYSNYLTVEPAASVSVPANGSVSFTVKPVDGLSVVTKRITMTFNIKDGQGNTSDKSVYIVLSVRDSFINNVTVGPEWSYITLIEGYSNASGVSITVTNNNDEAVTVENYSFDGYSNYLTVEPAASVSVPANGSVSFTVKPVDGLSVVTKRITMTFNIKDGQGSTSDKSVYIALSVKDSFINNMSFEPSSVDFGRRSVSEVAIGVDSQTIVVYNGNQDSVKIKWLEAVAGTSKFSGGNYTEEVTIMPQNFYEYNLSPGKTLTSGIHNETITWECTYADGTTQTVTTEIKLTVEELKPTDYILAPEVYDFGTVYADSRETWGNKFNFSVYIPSESNFVVKFPNSNYFTVSQTSAYDFSVKPKPRAPGTYEEELVVQVVDDDSNVVCEKTVKLKYAVGPATGYHYYKCSVVGCGRVSSYPQEGYVGEGYLVIMDASPDPGYEFRGWRVKSGGVSIIALSHHDGKLYPLTHRGFHMGYSDVEIVAYFSAPEVTIKTITIEESEGGSGTADPPMPNSVGTEITITAQPRGGYVFDYWEVIAGDVILDDPHSATTSFLSNGESVTLKPHFFKLTVTITAIEIIASEGGTGVADPPAAMSPGTTINLTAQPKGTHVFDHWEVVYGGVTLENPYSAQTSFTFQGRSVGVKPCFLEKGVVIFPVNILKTEGGTGIADPPATNIVGQTITVTAKPYAAYTFDHWEVLAGDIVLADPNSHITTFEATGVPVTLKPCFNPYAIVTIYATTIQYADGGTGGTAWADPEFVLKGESVDLRATANKGYYFKEWRLISGGISLENPKNAETSFMMGSENVVLTPVFELVTVTGIELNARDAKIEYEEGDELDVSGLILTATKADGAETIPVTKDMVSGFNSSIIGPQTLTVSYQGFTKNYEIIVKAKTIPPVSGTHTVTVSANPAGGGQVTGGGTYNHGDTATVTATANTGYTFTGWTKNGSVVSTNEAHSFTVNADTDLVAEFDVNTTPPPTQYTVNVEVENGQTGWGTVTGGGTYNEGESVTITATASTGYEFDRWVDNATGNAVSTNASFMHTVTGNISYVAVFKKTGTNPTPAKTHTVTVGVASGQDGFGSVTGGGVYTEGADVTVRATANTGYKFLRWMDGTNEASRDAEYTFTLGTANRSLTAEFEIDTPSVPKQYAVYVSANPAEGGIVTGGGIYNENATVTVTAIAKAGYAFDGWYEGITSVSKNASYQFKATSDRALEAHFSKPSTPVTPNKHIVLVSANPAEGGTVRGSGTYNEGDSVTVTASANTGYVFKQWTESGKTVSTDAVYTFTANATRNLTAEFSRDQNSPTPVNPPKQYSVTVTATQGGTVTGGGTYKDGETVKLTATADSGFHFVHFAVSSDPKTAVSKNNPYSFAISENVTLVAVFAPDSLYYTSGMNGTWQQESSSPLPFTTNGTYELFTHITVDGKVVASKDYEAESGSTIIRLKAAFLKSLSVGTHTLETFYTNGTSIATQFTIKAGGTNPANPTNPSNPAQPSNPGGDGSGGGGSTPSTGSGSGSATGGTAQVAGGLTSVNGSNTTAVQTGATTTRTSGGTESQNARMAQTGDDMYERLGLHTLILLAALLLLIANLRKLMEENALLAAVGTEINRKKKTSDLRNRNFKSQTKRTESGLEFVFLDAEIKRRSHTEKRNRINGTEKDK
ncbi:MAG: InlB B-repeat-containing protein, partial [Lachnospiraceae bacterium]|nr:InlB B-repeat-containing protein [Lachnospiraceae bacterium]